MEMHAQPERNASAGKSAICNLQSKIVVGLIGGIGSGKSLAAAAFKEQGAEVISGDQLGHEALRQPEIKKNVIEHWGNRVLGRDGEIDRHQLGKIVFADARERKKLEAMVFPFIEKGLGIQIAAAQADRGVSFIVVDAAVMLEAGWDKHCEKLVFVNAPRELRLRRLAEQRRWSAKEVEARENAQMSIREKRSRADAVLDNSGSAEALRKQVESLLRCWEIKK